MNKNHTENTRKKIGIYEIEGVYGDEKRYLSSLRFSHMIHFVKTLETKPKRILDIGCGTGFFSNEMKKIYPKATIYGLDVSKKAIAIARKTYPKVNFIFGDAEQELSFEDNFFDLIISGEHIEHLKDVDTYLIEVNRTLNQHGILILTTPNLGSWLNRTLLLFGLQPFYLEPSLRKTLPILTYFGKTFPEDLNSLPSGHLRLYTLNMLEKLLKHYGLMKVDVKGTTILKGLVLKQLDSFFSNFPSFSYGLVMKLKKND